MTSLSKNARVAGFLYLAGSLAAVVRLVYIPNTSIVDNATATVNNLTTHELPFRPSEVLAVRKRSKLS